MSTAVHIQVTVAFQDEKIQLRLYNDENITDVVMELLGAERAALAILDAVGRLREYQQAGKVQAESFHP